METKQRIIGVVCGALAGLTAGVLISLALWADAFVTSFSFHGLYELLVYDWDELLLSLRFSVPAGLILGAFMGFLMVMWMQKRVWQLRTWIGMGMLFAILSLSPYLVVLLLFWLGARIGITSAGEPLEWIFYIVVTFLVGGLAGGSGGFVGGRLFIGWVKRESVFAGSR